MTLALVLCLEAWSLEGSLTTKPQGQQMAPSEGNRKGAAGLLSKALTLHSKNPAGSLLTSLLSSANKKNVNAHSTSVRCKKRDVNGRKNTTNKRNKDNRGATRATMTPSHLPLTSPLPTPDSRQRAAPARPRWPWTRGRRWDQLFLGRIFRFRPGALQEKRSPRTGNLQEFPGASAGVLGRRGPRRRERRRTDRMGRDPPEGQRGGSRSSPPAREKGREQREQRGKGLGGVQERSRGDVRRVRDPGWLVWEQPSQDARDPFGQDRRTGNGPMASGEVAG